MTHFAQKTEVHADLDERTVQRVLDTVERANRFPVQGGDFLPTNRKGWFDAVTANQQVEEKGRGKVAK